MCRFPVLHTSLRAAFGRLGAWITVQCPAEFEDLQKLVDEGREDVPLIHLRYRCSRCGSRPTDWVVTSKSGGRPGTLLHHAADLGAVSWVATAGRHSHIVRHAPAPTAT
jgi:hypothetical protein